MPPSLNGRTVVGADIAAASPVLGSLSLTIAHNGHGETKMKNPGKHGNERCESGVPRSNPTVPPLRAFTRPAPVLGRSAHEYGLGGVEYTDGNTPPDPAAQRSLKYAGVVESVM